MTHKRTFLPNVGMLFLAPMLDFAQVAVPPKPKPPPTAVPEFWGVPEFLGFFALALLVFWVLTRFGLLRRVTQSIK